MQVKEYSNTDTSYGEYGGKIVSNTNVKVFDKMVHVTEAIKACRPLYLKHAFPRNGKIKESSDETSLTFSWESIADDGTLSVFHRTYRLELESEAYSRTKGEMPSHCDCCE